MAKHPPSKYIFSFKVLNPILAGCLQRTEFIEMIGSGIKRIKKLFPSVRFNMDTDWFCVIFKRQKIIEFTMNVGVNASVKDTVKDTIRLSSNQMRILTLIKDNGGITIEKLSSYIGINVRNIKNILKLKEFGLLERIGSDKAGYLKVIEK